MQKPKRERENSQDAEARKDRGWRVKLEGESVREIGTDMFRQ